MDSYKGYKVGDWVSIKENKEAKHKTDFAFGWNEDMERFYNKNVRITGFYNNPAYPSFYANDFTWSVLFLEEPISMEQRIIDKIKDIDSRWVISQQAKGNKPCGVTHAIVS